MDKALRHRVNAGRSLIEDQVRFFREYLGKVSSDWKADETRVTFADFAISENILNGVERIFPDDDFLSEEAGPMDECIPVSSKYAWVLDPIDGTNNFALGIAFCAISLAILKDGQPVYGFIYDMSKDVLMECGMEKGILINGRKADPRDPKWEPRSSTVAMHFPLRPEDCLKLNPLMELFRVRSMGSAALHLAYVALGQIDGVIDQKVKVWDIAAAYCFIQASGKEIYWLEDSNPFPLKYIERQSPRLAFFAGTADCCSFVQKLLG